MIRATILLVVLVPAQLRAQQDGPPAFTAGKPGPEHEKLRAFVGKWELTMEGG